MGKYTKDVNIKISSIFMLLPMLIILVVDVGNEHVTQPLNFNLFK